ncbi:pyruvate dehydrogenase (acetyl-transferring) E1 component subunit alpha [Candidatus Nesciobacter abundans]|uniref:Pyruvate dehydrogenase E1 component subunit alpha n=1 Tax=Candidatus Nesciobacter abundans TaxID=2601668 RepID=A0A5C0UG86_9PROT|nr:pyruvate dehydrogenase (acetyl-transferring) E1 component subunit alpha [Candidatus Nesciobacter abundans]QEK39115.1 pyruvate dehydrogenase (acetyl-transferring) E1 component subunit alpha [Candidatus Nesciobacter abundans]
MPTLFVDKDNKYHKIYKQMLLARKFEEATVQLYREGLIRGFCHPYIGQEAVLIGINSKMQSQDSMITGYRCHAHTIIAGCDPKSVMAELTGRSTGCSKGKGGSMHMFSIKNRFYGGHGIVGAWTSLGTGIGFSHKYKEDNGVCVVFLGDGSSNQGQFFESMNMASLWNLPVLYIIENNGYAIGTSVERSAAGGPLHKRGECFGIDSEEVDGMDVEKMSEAADRGLSIARSGKPYIIEAATYRFRPHSMSDPDKHRSKEEIDKYKALDPISSYEQKCLKNKFMTEDEVKQIKKEVKEIVSESVKFAKESPFPENHEMFEDLYTKSL